MPKKTKREKVIADDRHQRTALIVPQFQFRMGAHAQKDTTTSEFVTIQKDLVTTGALAAVAIISEILLAKIVR